MYFTFRNMQGKYNKRNSWIKLFQNQKLENELNDFQSVFIVSSHSPFLNEEGACRGGGARWLGGGGGVKFPKKWIGGLKFPKKWVKGKLIFGGHFLILSYHYN